MCGIFGIITSNKSKIGLSKVREYADVLFRLSESRGKESSGIAIKQDDVIKVIKSPMSASAMVASEEYRSFFNSFSDNASKGLYAIGHARLVTNGSQLLNDNNQPIIKHGMVCVHNGIVVNDAKLWDDHEDIKRDFQVDTEVILSLMSKFLRADSIKSAVAKTYDQIQGTASIAIQFSQYDKAILATNNGSLYYIVSEHGGCCIFASEKYILQEFIKAFANDQHDWPEVEHLSAGLGIIVDTNSLQREIIDLRSPAVAAPVDDATGKVHIVDQESLDKEARDSLRRCTRCILPETFPFISFNNEGVCSICSGFSPTSELGSEALKRNVEKYRSKDGSPDCIVPLSGGRDSCYALHYIKNILGMNPIAYTYDWGVITDLARRNQARMCGKLGVEHIIVSADIKRKRNNIKLNINAWLHRPHLGMIPLFMAGDKQYFYYVNKLAKQTGINLIIFGENIKFELTRFKSAFSGVVEDKRMDKIGIRKKVTMASFYGKEFLMNPRYLNKSIIDTLFGYYSYYIMKHDYYQLYNYLKWDEDEIVNVLIDEYDWELAPDTKGTWRIGDGTAAFYNFIYHTVAGFTENDTFRSNQIRYGLLSREQALRLVENENKPRYEAMLWYAQTMGFDLEKALLKINSMPKLYKKGSFV